MPQWISIGERWYRKICWRRNLCDLSKCKGACCVEGDAGAPLEKAEVQILASIFKDLKPYLRPEGIAAIVEQGTSVIDETDGEPVTPLVNGQECAYVTFDKNGTTKCGSSRPGAGVVSFPQPVPILTDSYDCYESLRRCKLPPVANL
ncbi:MAG: DUF3109 family protein [Owenweeksia sp.]|nr:DUF3109 family protein [Owenweeksia sp.]